MKGSRFIPAGELAARGAKDLPDMFRPGRRLVYSSPATLAFNSPGAQGFGVKRAGLAVPGSVMLLAAPRCCGRNTAALGRENALADRFYYLLLDDTDIVTGRHLARIPQAVAEICADRAEKPSAVMLCITCVDALLGTDMERVCRKCAELARVPVVPCYMYALTREGRLPPMAAVRKSVYSLLEPRPKRADAANLLGFFSPLDAKCELFALLKQAGAAHLREIARCADFAAYRQMAEANFNLVLNPEARYAAQDLQKRLGIPFVELARRYDTDRNRRQYAALGAVLGCAFDDAPYAQAAERAVAQFRRGFGGCRFAVGEWLNGDPFELALALVRYGFRVEEVFGTPGEANFVYLRKLAETSPETRVYSNLDPSMLHYRAANAPEIDAALGQDALHYHPDKPGLRWNGEVQPFGHAGVEALFTQLRQVMSGEVVR